MYFEFYCIYNLSHVVKDEADFHFIKKALTKFQIAF